MHAYFRIDRDILYTIVFEQYSEVTHHREALETDYFSQTGEHDVTNICMASTLVAVS